MCVLATLCAVSPGTAGAQAAASPPVIISEFVASNQASLTDNTGDNSDWIELHNTSGAPVDLAGWQLTAGSDVHTFTGLTIQADEYLVIFASGDPDRSTPDELHVDFKLGASGEALVLSDDTGQVSQPAWPTSYPAQYPDVSYGPDDAGALFFFAPPTPGAANGTGGLLGFVEPVTFSVEHGFYSQAQSVVLDTTTPSATIRYTTDASTPSATNGTAVSPGTAVAVTGTTNLRAVAVRDGWAPSNVETRTYLFTADIVQQPETAPAGWPVGETVNGMRTVYGIDADYTAAQRADVAASLTAIPSVSLTTDLENLFDPSTGIWTNPAGRGSEWERPVSVELIDPTGAQPGFDINGGFRIRGNSSRNIDNFKHSMRLVFDSEYEGGLEYPLYGPDGVDTFEVVDLKTAQSWSWNHTIAARVNRGTEATWLRDIWNHDTQGDMGNLHRNSDFVHTFINGQYWGLYMTEERPTNQFGSDYLGGNESDYDVIKMDTSPVAGAGRTVEVRDGQIDDWFALWPLVEDHTLTDAEWETFANEVDVVNLADYYLLMWVAGDSDATPRFTKNRSNNWVAMRNRAREGGAAKWIFLDLDSEAAVCTDVNATRPPDWDPTPPWDLGSTLTGVVDDAYYMAPSWLMEAALTRPEFVRIFQDRVQKHMLTPGGALTVAESVARLDARIPAVDLAVDAEAARWGDTWVTDGFDRSDWEPAVQTVRNCFALRTTVMEQYLREDGLWPLSDPPEITPAADSVDYGTNVTVDGSGDIWVTLDGSDPLGADGLPSATAFEYSGPITLTESVTVNARIDQGGGEWSPLASAAYDVGPAPSSSRIILNEWNAVDSDKVLKNGGTDATLGTVVGNGGDWFELVTIEDNLDLRGWSLEISDNDNAAGVQEITDVFTFADQALLSSLRAGTIVTVSEDIADDPSYDPAAGDWHINLQANSDDDGAFFTADSQSNFGVDNSDWQLTIRDASGTAVFGPAGEGAGASGVGSDEIGELEADPSADITSASAYDDGSDSTFGLPNEFDNRLQDFSLIRPALADTTDPDSVTTAPANGDVLTSTDVTIEGTATDNVGVAKMVVALRNRDTGGWLRTDGTSGAFQWHDATVDTPGAATTDWSYQITLSEARWLIVARAEDTSGNRDQIRVPTFITIEASVTDTEDPNGEVSEPADREIVSGPSVSLVGTATDDTGVSSARVVVKNRTTNEFLQSDGTLASSFARVDVNLDSPGATSTGWNLSANLPAGDYAVTLDVFDAAGNKDQLRARVPFTVTSGSVDLLEPDATIDNPVHRSTVSGPVVTASGTATDNVGVAEVQVAVQDLVSRLWLQPDGTFGSFSKTAATLTSPGAASTGWSLDLPLPPGEYAVTPRTTDTSGRPDSMWPRARFTVN